MSHCSSCHSEITNSSRFCSACGKAVESEVAFATETVATTPPPSAPKARSSSGAASSRPSSAAAEPARESRFLPGEIIAGRYRIVALLGRGGMGEVYRADDLTLGQQVALKFLPESLAGNPDSVARFRNEVRVARQVSHANVCRVYDVGEIEGHYFLSMEYVDGEDLASLLRRIGRLPADKALEISRRLCAGLGAAHDKGVLHRDLKPSNIMLDGRGQVLLTDFGLAGLAGEISGGEVRSGTPVYMAPEQLAGKEVTVRSDIYALGLVLYEIFTGKRPFEANTLAELIRARSETTPTSLTTLVRDLDPMVERVILRCLDPEPSKRPPSALAVSAALPGGDPLAAALAAGETPSPEMVAAAGEGVGLSPVIAVSVFGVIIAILIGLYVTAVRTSALEIIQPQYPPDVMAQKAKDIIQRLGYGGAKVEDDAYSFDWNSDLIGYINEHEKPRGQWSGPLTKAPSALRFWYRQSPEALTTSEFHEDLLTPSLIQEHSPPITESGMTGLTLDSTGRLLSFDAMPPERMEAAKTPAPAVDWAPLFSAAGLDPSQLKPAEPLWNFLAASDTRAAWTGTWPGSSRPLRVEAAALRGRPVAFRVMGPWTKPSRMPREGSANLYLILIGLLAVGICFAGALLAHRNLLRGRGDRRGALRLGVWMFAVLMAVWICRGHFTASIDMLGMFFLALCTTVFYGVVMWALYLALEPFVRSRWPQTLISWTTLLSGRMKDPVVGRDALFGIVLALLMALIGQVADVATMARPDWTPDFASTEALLGARRMLGVSIWSVADQVRTVLFFFFLLFLLRVLLRNQWLAAASWVLIFTALFGVRAGNQPITWGLDFIIFALQAIFVLRWGLLSLAVGYALNLFLGQAPVTTSPSAWYFGNVMYVIAATVALAAWSAYVSMGGRKLWKQDLFE